MPTVAESIVDVLISEGIDKIFGIPGGASAAFYSAFLNRPNLQVILAKHETNAVFLAMGYALATHRPGIVLTTCGPGITNALTGLASAKYEFLPIIHLAGEIPTTAFGRGAFQESSPYEIDAVGLARHIVKYAVQINRPDSAVPTIRRAISTAMSGMNGPVFVSVPLDIGSSECSCSKIGGVASTTFATDAILCTEVAKILEGSRRPMILAGSDCRDRAARRALKTMAEHFGIPVAVTPTGKGVFPELHSLYLGVLGFGGHESVVKYLAGEVDSLVVCGADLNDFSTNAWSPCLKAKDHFIHIDIDSARIGRNYPVDIGIVGPIEKVIEEICSRGAQSPVKPSDVGILYQKIQRSPHGELTTADVIDTLNKMCPEDAFFTCDIGEHLSFAIHFLKIGEKAGFITPLGFGSMGSGICTGIGYQIAQPERRVFVICGDGGFLMSGNELATAVKYRAPCTILIINDHRFNMCHHGMIDMYGKVPDFNSQLVDFAGIAKAMGADGFVIRTQSELEKALAAPVHGPLVLDIRVDPDVRVPGSQRNAALRHFANI